MKDYIIDFDSGRVVRKKTDMDSVLFKVHKLLQTERNRHAVYRSDYGVPPVSDMADDYSVALVADTVESSIGALGCTEAVSVSAVRGDVPDEVALDIQLSTATGEISLKEAIY